jgi:hypothetical protein
MRTLPFRRSRVHPVIFDNTDYHNRLAKRLHCKLLRPFICALCRCLALDPLGWNGRGAPLCEACADGEVRNDYRPAAVCFGHARSRSQTWGRRARLALPRLASAPRAPKRGGHFRTAPGECGGCGRVVPDVEIWGAIHDSQATAWRPRVEFGQDVHESATRPRWPAVDPSFRARVIERTGFDLSALNEHSTIRFDDAAVAEAVLPWLFKERELVCVAREKTKAATAPLAQFRGALASLQFIVPSPMSSVSGLNKQGRPSPRCLNNTGPRRFLIVEFDHGTKDEQAALLVYLATFLDLVLVVDSGGKSLHGWFRVRCSDDGLRPFMERAVRLGADSGMWVRCQLARMPGGLRENGARQVVHYFEPGVLA